MERSKMSKTNQKIRQRIKLRRRNFPLFPPLNLKHPFPNLILVLITHLIATQNRIHLRDLFLNKLLQFTQVQKSPFMKEPTLINLLSYRTLRRKVRLRGDTHCQLLYLEVSLGMLKLLNYRVGWLVM